MYYNFLRFLVTVDKIKKSEEDGGALTDGENGKLVSDTIESNCDACFYSLSILVLSQFSLL